MEGLLTALLNIHGTLAPLTEPATDNVEAIAGIYALVLFLLTEFMDWYVRRSTCQLLKSHSQDAYSEFHHLVSCVQRQAKALPASSDLMDVDDESDSAYSPRALWEESQLSQVGRQGTERRIAAQNTITRRLIWEIQQDAEERARIREQRDQLLAQMLGDVSEQLRPVSEQSSGIVCLTTAAPDLGRIFVRVIEPCTDPLVNSDLLVRMVPRVQASSRPSRAPERIETSPGIL